MLPPPIPTSRRTHPPPLTSIKSSRSGSRRKTPEEYEEPDAEGEEEEVGEVAEDEGVYCTCGHVGGEMVGCDNDDCPIAWVGPSFFSYITTRSGTILMVQYHLECVGLKNPLPETWYCPSCVRLLGLSSSSGNDKSQKDKKRNRK